MLVEIAGGKCEWAIEAEGYAHIFNLEVDLDCRRQGIARKLVAECVRLIREAGWTGEIQVVADPVGDAIDKASLAAFYAEMGIAVYEMYA